MAETQPARQTLEGRAAFRDAALALVRGARLQLALLSHELEREIYGETAFCEAVQAIPLRHHQARIRVLVHSPEWAGRSGHRLVELARRLSSFIEIRELAEEDKGVTSEILIGDERALLQREFPDDLVSSYFPDSPLQARHGLERFDSLWDRSQPVPGLRRLHL